MSTEVATGAGEVSAQGRWHSKAPTRIDLAGGTVDLWPLYLFLDRPVTINLGIDLFAEATLEVKPAAQPVAILKSEDQGHELKLEWPAIMTSTAPAALELHLKFLRHFLHEAAREGRRIPSVQLTLATRAKSPAGAGLGGSSTLSIAMIGALASWSRGRPVDVLTDGEALIEVARDVETTVIQVPAGVQDYYGAMFGGLQSLRWRVSQHEREWLPTELLAPLESRLLLFYSGQSRNSGINNWALFKGFIDREADVRERFGRIAGATRELETALRAQNWAAAGEAIAHEWETRKTLAAGITTPAMDLAFKAAEKIAPVAGKVCGAGGGGCFFVYLRGSESHHADARARITAAFEAQGIRALPFRSSPHGLNIQMGN